MRRRELLGLQWQDVDLDRGEVAVRRTLGRGATSKAVLGRPKTTISTRSIALPNVAVTSLRSHADRQVAEKARAGDAWKDNGFVFTNALGDPIHPNTLQRQFEALIRTAGVPRIRLHDVRHTNATLLVTQDVHPKIVQERLGHSTIGMTLDLYSHSTPHLQRRAVETLDRVFEAPQSPEPDLPARS